MNKILYISLLVSVTLACGSMPASQLVQSPNPTQTEVQAAETESACEIPMIVTGLYEGEPLNIRVEANGAATDEYLYNGDVVCLLDELTIGDTLWCKHAQGWSACRYLVGYNETEKKEK